MHHIRLAALTAALLITHASNTSVSVRALPALAALPGGEDAVVVAITDGDTIDVTINGAPATVRYIGIDTPETKQPNAPVQCYGPEASAANAAKGNINRKNEHIYHRPGQRDYNKTKPETCFASNEEAEAAGFRAAKR